MNNLSDEEEVFLREEKAHCVEGIKDLQRKLQRIIDVKAKYEVCISELKLRHNQADRRLANFNLLTVIRRERKSSTVDALEKILQDEGKAKKLMELLKEEMKNES